MIGYSPSGCTVTSTANAEYVIINGNNLDGPNGTVTSFTWHGGGNDVSIAMSGLNIPFQNFKSDPAVFADSQILVQKFLHGNDILNGTKLGGDTLSGGNGNDTLYGFGDNDQLDGDAGNDRLYGGAGRDRLDGGSEDDLLVGDLGDDLLPGRDGNNVLNGGLGVDNMLGGRGNDIITLIMQQISLKTTPIQIQARR